MDVALTSIVIGSRVRKDMGDIDILAKSIACHGLLHPVVVKKDFTLIAGARRLAAVTRLGWKEIPVTMIEVSDLLAAERDENETPKRFTPSEAVAIGRLIEEQHRAKIAMQQREVAIAAGKQSAAKRAGKSTTCVKELGVQTAGPTREAAANAVGMSQKSYTQAKAVVAAAEVDPQNFGDLPEKMDTTGNVSATHRELQHRRVNGAQARSAVHYGRRHPRPNAEIENTLATLAGICLALESLSIADLDKSKSAQWVQALRRNAAFLNRIAKRIKHEC